MNTSSYGESTSIPQTDSVIQQYEKVIERRIAEKILKSSQKSSVLPTFTEEETAFLKVRAGNISSELVVETPTPNITIKQGNTELNIGHAAEIIKKMEERFPTGIPNDKKEEIYERHFASIEHGFKKAPTESEKEPVQINSTPSSEQLEDCLKNRMTNNNREAAKTNKNAYEIRTEVLGMALDWVKFKGADSQRVKIDDDVVLTTAKKFYNFVEKR